MIWVNDGNFNEFLVTNETGLLNLPADAFWLLNGQVYRL